MAHNKNNQQIWVIGVINNIMKNFRLKAKVLRDSEHLKKFVFSYINKGNVIITDGCIGI